MEAKRLTADRFVDGRMGCSYRYVYSDTEYFRIHDHDYYEIFILLDGEARHLVNGGDFPLRRGCVIFIRPSDLHDYLRVDGKPFSMLNITFTVETAEALFSYLGEGFDKQRLLASIYPPEYHFTEAERVWLDAYMAGVRAIDPDNVERLRTALRILLFRLFTKRFSTFSEAEPLDMPPWLVTLCNEMRKNENFIHGGARMYELSDRSREHVARTLKKYTGMTVSEFVNDLRLHFVANMLLNSNHSIAHILFESGFNNVGWASDLFRRKYGMTMRDYRKSGGSYSLPPD